MNIRKILAGSLAAVMTGATMGFGAMAANYPSPFTGSADTALVYGSSAALTDLAATVSIANDLNSKLSGGLLGTSASGGSSSTGDSYALFTGSSPLLLNASLNSVRTTVTESNLNTVFADTETTMTSGSTDDSSIKLTHRLTLGSYPRAVFAKEPTSNDDPSVGLLLGTTAGNYLYNATITFSKTINFTDAQSKGNDIEMFGQKFTVASATDTTNLVLFKSAEKLYIDSENPTASFTVGEKSYTAELVSASDSAATIRITDSSGKSEQKEINEAASAKINGVEVAVDTADETNQKLTASLIVGANRVKMQDGSEILLGTEETPIEGTQVSFEGDNTAPFGMTSLVVQVFAPSGSEDFLKAGNSFIDPVFGTFKLDFADSTSMAGEGTSDVIKIDPSGNDKMAVSFTNWQGKEITNFEWVNNESSAWGKAFLGDSSDWRIFTKENSKINESAYAVVGNEEDGYLVKLRTITNSTGTSTDPYGNDRVVFENVFDTEQTWEAVITAEGTGTIDIGGTQYTVTYWDDRDGDNDEYVKLQWPDTSGNDIVAFSTIQTSKGAKVFFYEPLIIDLNDASEAGSDAGGNVTEIFITDGNGYAANDANIVTTVFATGPGNNFTVTVGSGSATSFNTTTSTVPVSADGLIGLLRWNLSSGVTQNGRYVDNGTAVLYLEDIDGTVIKQPAFVLYEEQDDATVYNAVIIKTGGAGTSDNGIGVSDVDFTWNRDTDMSASGSSYGASGLQRDSDSKIYDMMDIWGTLVTTDQSTSDQYSAELTYPDDQYTAKVYATEGSVSISGASTPKAVSTVTELGVIAVKDSEVASVATKNLIVVGGSAVNSVAATLKGLQFPTYGNDWTAATGVGAGQFLIQGFATSSVTSKTALLIAGYEAADTTNAATYLTTNTVDTSKTYKGTSATSAELVTQVA